MRVAINCRSFLKKQYAGIGRYTHNLVDSLAKIDKENEYHLYSRLNFLDFKRHVPKSPGKNFTVKADWFNQGLEKTLDKIDIYHSPSPDFIDIEKAKIVVTVHDLVYRLYPQGHTQETIETTDRQLREIVKKADKIICCSQNTVDDLNRYFYLDRHKVSLVYQGVDKDNFYPMDDQDKTIARKDLSDLGVSEPFILFVGTNEPRKNLKNLLFALVDLKNQNRFKGKLAVVGMEGWLNDDIQSIVTKLEIKDNVHFLGYVSNEMLRNLYNLCEVFVFPSFYEGFGFPLVEAFSCGAAVVTSNISSCPEVAKDAALISNPSDPREIASAIEHILEDQKLKSELKIRALRRANDFSFSKTAQETLKVYQDVYRLK